MDGNGAARQSQREVKAFHEAPEGCDAPAMLAVQNERIEKLSRSTDLIF